MEIVLDGWGPQVGPCKKIVLHEDGKYVVISWDGEEVFSTNPVDLMVALKAFIDRKLAQNAIQKGELVVAHTIPAGGCPMPDDVWEGEQRHKRGAK